MGTNAPHITSIGTAVSTTAGATQYAAMGAGANPTLSSTEANRQIKFRQAGTISKGWIHVGTSSTSSSSTVRTRKNGANGNITITIGAGLTGDFEDATHTDTIAAGDNMNWQTVSGGTGTMGINHYNVAFASSGTGAYSTFVCGSALALTTASATRFNGVCGVGAFGSTEANVEFYVRDSFTLKNLGIYVSANSWATNVTFKNRVNGADGNLSITIGSGLTGLFEQTSGSDTLVSGDRFCFAVTTLTGTSKSITMENLWIGVDNASGLGFFNVQRSGAVNTTAASTQYVNPAGALTGTYQSAEGDIEIEARVAYDVNNLNANISANAATGSSSITARKAASADTALTITIGAGLTGQFTDTTNDITGNNATDQWDYKVVTGAGGVLTPRNIAMNAAEPSAGLALVKLANETEEISESVNRLKAESRNINETEEIAEALNYIRGRSKVVSEEEQLSEAINYVRSRLQLSDESISVSESVNIARELVRLANEDVSITEAVNRIMDMVRQPAVEEEQISESINYVRGRIQNITELVEISEQIARLAGRVRIVNEEEQSIESVVRIAERIRQQDESIEIGEAVNVVLNLVRIANEQVEANEAISQNRALTAVINETEELLEQASRRTALTRVVDETQQLLEAINYGLAKVRVIDEQTDLTETLVTAITRIHEADESIDVSEAINVALGKTKVVDEGVDISEDTAALRGLAAVINENVELVESLNRVGVIVRNVNEQAIVSELVSKIRGRIKKINEVQILVEQDVEPLLNVPEINAIVIAINEVIEMPESQMSVLGKVQVINEAVSLLEAIDSKLTQQIVTPPPSTGWSSGFAHRPHRRYYARPVFKERIVEREKIVKVYTVSKQLVCIYNIEGVESVLHRLETNALSAAISPPRLIFVERTREVPVFVRAAEKKQDEPILLKQVHIQKVSKQLSMPYHIYQNVNSTLSASYNIMSTVVKPLEAKFSRRQVVSKQLKCSYNIRDARKYERLKSARQLFLLAEKINDFGDLDGIEL